MPQTRQMSEPTIADALNLLRKGRFAEADRILVWLAGQGDVRAMVLAGKVALQGKRFEDAIRWCRMALDVGETMDRLNDMGVALAASGAGDQAAIYYQKAIGANPDSPLPFCNMGRMLHSQGKTAEALSFLQRAVVRDPNYPPGQLYLGVALVESGQAAAAKPVLEQAVKLWPTNPLTHIYLSKALDLCDEPAAAQKCCQEALKLDPDHVIALADMGGLLYRAGKLEQALKCFARYLVKHPNHGGMMNNCGLMRMQLGRWDEAIEDFRRALSCTQPYVGALINLGSALQLSEHSEEALATFKRACKEMPDNPQAFIGLADMELTLGNPDGAYAAFLRAVELGPDSPEYYRRLVSLGKKWPLPPDYRAKLDAMEARAPKMSDRDCAEMHFALYRLSHDEEQYTEACRHLLAANAARRKTVRYSKKGVVRLYQRIKADTPAELFTQKTGLGDPSDLPVFIVGMPRSGTTLLEQVLASHPGVFGAGELTDFSTVVHTRPDDIPESDIAHLSGGDLQILARRYLERMKKRAPGANRVINKLPWNCFLVGYIHLLMPKAQILHIQRDAMDCCFSCYEQNFRGDLDFSYEQTELGHYYRTYEEMMAHWRAVLPKGTICDVSYEQLVENFEPEVRRVLDYCHLDWDPACLDFYHSKRAVMTASVMQVRRPLYSSSVGRWKHYADALAPLLDALKMEDPVAAAGMTEL